MELPIVLDAFSHVPLWKQLFDALHKAIERGQLRNNDPLPPTREMSKQLQVSRDTVVRAYDELVSRGYATATTGAGTFVKYSSAATATMPAQSIDVDGLSDYAQRLLNIEPARATCADYQSLNYGAPPRNMLPAKQWREVLAHQNELQQPDSLTYENDIFGYRPLREELAAYLRRTRGMDCTTDQVVVFSDSQHALDLLSRV